MGAGFIGCIILEALAKRGVELTVVSLSSKMSAETFSGYFAIDYTQPDRLTGSDTTVPTNGIDDLAWTAKNGLAGQPPADNVADIASHRAGT